MNGSEHNAATTPRRPGQHGDPGAAGRIGHVPDHWTVWAFADIHGVASGFETALQAAGLVDADLRWAAPAETALVGCGDYVDRGTANRRVTALLRRLEEEAAAAGSVVIPARGNHDHLLSTLAEGTSDDLATWLTYGGESTLDDFGLPLPSPADPAATLRRMDEAQAGFLAWLAALPHAVRWRDVLFVHGGLPPWAGLDDLGTETEQHLYVRREWFTTAWETGVFTRFEAGRDRAGRLRPHPATRRRGAVPRRPLHRHRHQRLRQPPHARRRPAPGHAAGAARRHPVRRGASGRRRHARRPRRCEATSGTYCHARPSV